MSLCPLCPSHGSGFGFGETCRPDPVLSLGTTGQVCDWEPGGFCPSRYPSRLLDPYSMAQRGAPCAHLCAQARTSGLWRGSRIGAMRPRWSIGSKTPTNRGLDPRGRPASATRGSALEGQSPSEDPAPVRDPRAADERRIGVQVIAAARSSPLKGRNPCCCLALNDAGG